jgi:hypothetical protein
MPYDELRGKIRIQSWIGVFAFVLNGCASSKLIEVDRSLFSSRMPAAESSTHRIAPGELEDEIARRVGKIEAFRFLGEYGQKNRVRIYAAGGTAAGLGSYAKQFLENQAAKKAGAPLPYFESRFGDDYYDVYRSTQDADIVIHVPQGDAAAHERVAQDLEKAMSERFQYLQGDKSVWEIRFLSFDRGKRGEPGHKDALLGWDFQNQHTDSYSTGLIELTTPASGVKRVRDVKHWNSSGAGPFLEDLASGTVRFYHEPNHVKTLRASNGMNPEILSVIRLYSKAFQYDARVAEEGAKKASKILSEFDPVKSSRDTYVRKQIVRNGLKLYLHSMDIERASEELDRIGLKKILLEYGRIADFGSSPESRLSDWMARKPLRSFPLGKGPRIEASVPYEGYRPTYKRVSELIQEGRLSEIVAHTTREYGAFESIIRSRSGAPNVFESVARQKGQAADYGDGFYVKVGEIGAWERGFDIRFKLNPDAVEGIDFYFSTKDALVIKNRSVLKVVDEVLDLDPVQFVSLLFSQRGVKNSSIGLLENLSKKRKIQEHRLSPEERAQVRKILQDAFQSFSANPDADLASIRVFFSIPFSRDYLDVVEALINQGDRKLGAALAECFSNESWASHPHLLRRLIDQDIASGPIIEKTLSKAHWTAHPEFVEYYLGQKHFDRQLTESVLSKEHWSKNPKWKSWVETVIQRNGVGYLSTHILSRTFSVKHPEWFNSILESGDNDYSFAKHALSQPHWAHRPDAVERVLARGKVDHILVFDVLTKPFWTDRWRWIAALIEKGNVDSHIIEAIFKDPASAKKPSLLLQMIQKPEPSGWSSTSAGSYYLARGQLDDLLSMEHWRTHPLLRRICSGSDPTLDCLEDGVGTQARAQRRVKTQDFRCIRLLRRSGLKRL